MVLTHSEYDGHETVVSCSDPTAGLTAIIAVHSTRLGPALGGCRMWPYASKAEAMTDALRLSQGMTYKSALAGLSLGGGKAVIQGDPRRDKTPALFQAMGRFIDSLGGRYITAEDVGIKVADVEAMGIETNHVAGTPAKGSGDPSPATALGVFEGIRACLRQKFGRADFAAITIAIQGLGSVGWKVAERLHEAGAKLVVADIHEAILARARNELGAKIVAPEVIYDQSCDVFAPCALGAVINDETLPRLKAGVVAGSANNQLAEARHGAALKTAGILYAPDYAINAGGIINISHEVPAYDHARAFADVARIGDTLLEVFSLAESRGLSTAEAADRLAETRLNSTRPVA